MLFGTDGNLFERANFPPVPIGEGQGDLVLVDADPLAADGAALRAMPVALTLLGGRATYAAL